MKTQIQWFILTSCLCAILINTSVSARDPAYWPFSKDSPWNYPICSNAVYQTIQSPGFNINNGANVNCLTWSHPIFIAQYSDPKRNVKCKEEIVFSNIHIPDTATPDPEFDGHLHIISPEHNTVYELYGAVKQSDKNWEASNVAQNDLRGISVSTTPWYWNGVRAYGGSAIGGLIRKGELLSGIPHAVAVAVKSDGLNKNGPNDYPFVWPASCADSEWESIYGSSGNIYMGSLLAIPRNVDIRSIGVGTSGPAFEIARALQDYGCYIVDSTVSNMVFQVEPAANTEVPSNLSSQVDKIIKYLKVVTNNRHDNIGGGGMPYRNFAPSFSPSNTGVSIWMPSNQFMGGDCCGCDIYINNSEWEPINDCPLFAILEIYGSYYFAPGYSDFEYYTHSFLEGQTRLRLLDQFEWPYNMNTGNARWYGALTDEKITGIIGEMGQFEFNW